VPVWPWPEVVVQLITPVLSVTVPTPLLPLFKMSTLMVTGEPVVNVAVTPSTAVIEIVQVPVPLHAALPLQPVNVEPEFGAAVSTTLAFALKFAEHVVPQLMPVGELVTVPVPVPAFVTVNANCVVLKVAVTLSAALIVIVQVPVPLHAALPLHPANVFPLFGVAVRVTGVPLA
jgi:hypothetical protein